MSASIWVVNGVF